MRINKKLLTLVVIGVVAVLAAKGTPRLVAQEAILLSGVISPALQLPINVC